VKVHVIGELCTGHGRCWTLAPEVYDADDSGYNGGADTIVDVPPELEVAALKGVRNCPEAALVIVEEESA
jgi:ferredoxin